MPDRDAQVVITALIASSGGSAAMKAEGIIARFMTPVGRERDKGKARDEEQHPCSAGWICEAHPERGWPHDDCAGPGMLCRTPGCPSLRLSPHDVYGAVREPLVSATSA